MQLKECKTISFKLNTKDLGFHDENMNYVVEPGLFKVYVGTNSKEGIEGEFTIVSLD